MVLKSANVMQETPSTVNLTLHCYHEDTLLNTFSVSKPHLVGCVMQIAFSSISLALRYYLEDMKLGTYQVHHGVVAKQPGSGPNEAGAFHLKDHFAVQTQEPVMETKMNAAEASSRL